MVLPAKPVLASDLIPGPLRVSSVLCSSFLDNDSFTSTRVLLQSILDSSATAVSIDEGDDVVVWWIDQVGGCHWDPTIAHEAW
jgi:hypothetical protein